MTRLVTPQRAAVTAMTVTATPSSTFLISPGISPFPDIFLLLCGGSRLPPYPDTSGGFASWLLLVTELYTLYSHDIYPQRPRFMV